jgi:putative spermidine/putrescine transport system substrate-binding protein
MLSRRSFLISASSIALSQVLSGCSDREEILKIFLLQRTLPAQLISEFKKQLPDGKKIDFQSESQLKNILDLLESWQKSVEERQKEENWFPLFDSKIPDIGDLVSLGDYWLTEAIAKQLIQPLNLNKSTQWQKVPPLWQQLVQRNTKGDLDINGAIWGAPYRSGMTLIIYNEDKFAKFGWKPQDWQDLWRKELTGRISLLDNPREIIGLTLKKLGYSYNTQDISKIADLEAQLQALHQQTKFYDNKDYLQPLMLEDTWLAVGWSSDILPLLPKHRNFKAIVPSSGTSLWADLWVRPKISQKDSKQRRKATNEDFITQWLDFCWQKRSANEISLFSNGTSPTSLSIELKDLPTSLQNNPLIIFDRTTLAKSEFLQPFGKMTTEAYQSLWEKIRNTNKSLN